MPCAQRADLQHAGLGERRVGGAVKEGVGLPQLPLQRLQRGGGLNPALPQLPRGACFCKHNHYTPLVKCACRTVRVCAKNCRFIRFFPCILPRAAHILPYGPETGRSPRRGGVKTPRRSGRDTEMRSLRCDGHVFFHPGVKRRRGKKYRFRRGGAVPNKGGPVAAFVHPGPYLAVFAKTSAF